MDLSNMIKKQFLEACMRLIAKFKLFIKGKLYFFELWNLTLLTPPPPTNYGIFHNFFFLNEGFPKAIINSK